jgi:hypothetical protein
MAFAFACGLAVHAQDVSQTTKTKVKTEAGQTVTYTGCVQTGTETKTYTLNNVVPISRTTERVGTTGETRTTTTYALIPGEKVQFQQFVGHKVEVTGVMVPAGDSKVETKTKIERENAPDVKVKEKTKTENALPQFRVISIKHLADSCM